MRGLLAIELLYHQIVRGNKTQTRRSGGLELVNGQKATKTKPAIISNPDDWVLQGKYITTLEVVKEFTGKDIGKFSYLFINKVGTKVWCKPRYKVGEVIFLKEPTAKAKIINGNRFMLTYTGVMETRR